MFEKDRQVGISRKLGRLPLRNYCALLLLCNKENKRKNPGRAGKSSRQKAVGSSSIHNNNFFLSKFILLLHPIKTVSHNH